MCNSLSSEFLNLKIYNDKSAKSAKIEKCVYLISVLVCESEVKN